MNLLVAYWKVWRQQINEMNSAYWEAEAGRGRIEWARYDINKDRD